MALSKSDLFRLRDQDFAPMVRNFMSTAEEHLDKLSDFGITPESTSEILATLEDFNSLVGKPRNILNKRYIALSTLEELFTETTKLLKTRMDNIMLMFRESNHEFYDGYQRARTIVDI